MDVTCFTTIPHTYHYQFRIYLLDDEDVPNDVLHQEDIDGSTSFVRSVPLISGSKFMPLWK